MATITVTKQFRFDAAHRVLGHQGKCKHLHGHTYVAEVTVEPIGPVAGSLLDTMGMVIDFSHLKDTVGKWIDDNWDHNVILHPDDPLAQFWAHRKSLDLSPDQVPTSGDVFGGKDPYVMPERLNPTAENMASLLWVVADRELARCGFGMQVHVRGVRVYETPTCFAEFSK